MLIVTTPPVSTNLISVGDAYAELGGTDNLTVNDPQYVVALIAAASSAIVNWLGQPLAAATYLEVVRLSALGGYTRRSKDTLALSRWPVSAITSIFEGSTALVAGVDFEADLDRGFVYRLDGADSRRSWTAPKISVAYSAGYTLPIGSEAAGNLPAEITRACALLVRDCFFARARDVSIRSVAPDGLTIAFGNGNPGDGMPKHIEDLLRPWRAPVL
ncbi:MAG: hypothetical protein WCJ64_05740 [Rhodospirillaceae bacterium]